VQLANTMKLINTRFLFITQSFADNNNDNNDLHSEYWTYFRKKKPAHSEPAFMDTE
jgi:hypothetical protein